MDDRAQQPWSDDLDGLTGWDPWKCEGRLRQSPSGSTESLQAAMQQNSLNDTTRCQPRGALNTASWHTARSTRADPVGAAQPRMQGLRMGPRGTYIPPRQTAARGSPYILSNAARFSIPIRPTFASPPPDALPRFWRLIQTWTPPNHPRSPS